MKSIIVDTDILINFLRGKKRARDFLLSIVDEAAVCCSVITVAEIYAGMKHQERKETSDLIDSLHIYDISRSIAEKAGEYKREAKKQVLELDDCLIAATAHIEKAVLASGNIKHYPMSGIDKIMVK